jgi:NAD(P)-dependent dehydrogenase (short-subunit alcohol dehydrogenase family)
MTTHATSPPTQREPELLGQTVVVIGGSAGIRLETARRARAEGADVILTGRNPERLNRAALDVDARSTAAFDANDAPALKQFFDGLPDRIDHVMVTAGGPSYGPLLEMDSDQVREAISDHVVLGLEVARNAAGKTRAGGTLLLMGGTGGRRISRRPRHRLCGHGRAASVRGRPCARARAGSRQPHPGFVDTPLSASLLGDQLEERRNELRTTLLIGRGPMLRRSPFTS